MSAAADRSLDAGWIEDTAARQRHGYRLSGLTRHGAPVSRSIAPPVSGAVSVRLGPQLVAA